MKRRYPKYDLLAIHRRMYVADFNERCKMALCNVPRETTIINKQTKKPMAKIKDWFSSRDWRGLVTFLVKWVVKPSAIIAGYETTNYLISNF